DNDTADTGRTLDLTSVELDGADSGSDGKTLTVDGEGLWTVNATTGVITFEPESGFTLDPTPVQYTIRDDQGNVSNLATVTVDYVPVAVDDESTGNPIGEPVIVDVTANDTDGDTVDPTTVVIVDADEGSDGLTRTVENEGTWTVDPVTGAITFDPETGFTGNPTVVSYTVEDDEGNISDPASVTVTYDQTGSIAGLIEIDTTGDGLGDTPQENVTIALFDSGGGPVLDGNNDPITTVTDASGAYSFSDLEPGDYQVQQTVFTGFIAIDDVDGGDLTINGDVNPISVNPGVNVTGQDFVNSQFGVVDAIEFCLTLDGGILGGSFERETDFPENVTWYVEYAIELADPTTWQGTVLLDSGNTTVNDNGDGTETVTMADIPSLTGLADGFGFVRIRMELDANEDGSADEIQSSAVSGWRETSSGLSCKTYHDPFLSCPLLRAAIDSVDGTTLTLDQAAENLPSEGSFYLEVVNGDWEGQRWDVVASNGNELTVAETAEISFFESPYNTRTGSPPETLSGADVVLLRHQTLRGILPVDGLEAGNVASEADHAILLEEHGFETYWLYENGGSPVWVRSGDATLEDQGDKIIAPGEAILFQPFQTETTLLAFGQVRENSFIRNFREGYQMVGSGFPLSQSPDDRDMTTAEGFTGSRDFSQADRLYRWRPDLGSEGQGWETTFLLYTGPFEQWTRIGDTSFASQNGEALFVPNRGVYFFMEAPLGEHREPLPWNP
ncbi:MAG: hypothetical protein LAT58_13185, partial [Opitutales bacterium]|nr:hypothetical protein [Opitutales bacterium]